jgi:hypothetical protein
LLLQLLEGGVAPLQFIAKLLHLLLLGADGIAQDLHFAACGCFAGRGFPAGRRGSSRRCL